MAISDERVKVNGDEGFFCLRVEEDRSFEDEENRFVKDVKRHRNGKGKRSEFKMESWRKSLLSFSSSLDSLDLKGQRESLLSGISSGDSSISWAEDAVENEFTEKLKVLWNNIEGVCGNSGSPLKPEGMSMSVFNECLDWRRAFPQQNILTFNIDKERVLMNQTGQIVQMDRTKKKDFHSALSNPLDRITPISIPPTPVLTPLHEREERKKEQIFGPQLVEAWLTACDEAEKHAAPLYEFPKPKPDIKRDKFPKPPSPRPRRTNGSKENFRKNSIPPKRTYSAIPPRPKINPDNFFSALAFVEKIQEEKLPLRNPKSDYQKSDNPKSDNPKSDYSKPDFYPNEKSSPNQKCHSAVNEKPKENPHSFLDFVPEFELKPLKNKESYEPKDLMNQEKSYLMNTGNPMKDHEKRAKEAQERNNGGNKSGRKEEMMLSRQRDSTNNFSNWSRHHSPQQLTGISGMKSWKPSEENPEEEEKGESEFPYQNYRMLQNDEPNWRMSNEEKDNKLKNENLMFKNVRRPRPNFLQLRKTEVDRNDQTVSPFLFWIFDRASPL